MVDKMLLNHSSERGEKLAIWKFGVSLQARQVEAIIARKCCEDSLIFRKEISSSGHLMVYPTTPAPVLHNLKPTCRGAQTYPKQLPKVLFYKKLT
jgi:hypothetical protein